ncbi:MAG TPA: hypothetical protein VE954_42965 [Oligoflexus sp.]|uniref:hypothetical protein n=1 Tax=Oligoflexus sp. TaxID=1971216 RepID=UPI002D52F6E5|nr:hypothetical protein [Oligoflexus sp.]HYX39905.1 hypothetical protein [Oligoflexus sp.]
MIGLSVRHGFGPWVRIAILALALPSLSGCYFFKKNSVSDGTKQASSAEVLGASLGEKAGELNETALAEVHAISTTHAPAGVRPDPDTFVRQLLLQYREQGAVVAREIGRVEEYRMLLGGASNNFAIVPQETYDATSLLAELKVAEEVCKGLVDPDERQHAGWDSILPGDPSDTNTNIRFLAQRLIGLPSTNITEDALTQLNAILQTALVDGRVTHASYIPVCATLLIDAEALLL